MRERETNDCVRMRQAFFNQQSTALRVNSVYFKGLAHSFVSGSRKIKYT